MFLAYSCLNSLHVETQGHWFAFGQKVCESEYRAFSDETTFSPAHSDHSGRFDQQHATGAASKIGRRTNLCLSGSSSRRGPLYPSTAQRRDVAKVSAQLSGVARFQSPLFHSERCRRSDRQIRNRVG